MAQSPQLKASVEAPRPRRDHGYALSIHDPQPVESIDDLRPAAAEVALIGMFALSLVAAFYFARPVLLPTMAAFIVGTTLAPIVKAGARHRISPWVTAVALGVALLIIAGAAVTLLAKPISEWVAKAPEIGINLKQKLYVLDRPLAALRELEDLFLPQNSSAVAVEPSQLGIVTPVLAVITPAATQLALFFVTLIFFLAAQIDFRRYMVSLFSSRDAKLRFIRIANDIELNLVSYLAIVTVINFGLGLAVTIGAWLFGLPSPIILGILAMSFNYIPYLGAACVTLILFVVGIITYPSFGYALLPPAAFVALATIEGQFITPTVLGHRLTLNPLAVLLALAFWAWLWGPLGAFLAVPVTIIVLVTVSHLFPDHEGQLPG